MTSCYDGKMELSHGVHGLRDDVLICSNKMKATDNTVDREIGETSFGVFEHIDYPGV
jgi:hypothetical protein